MALSPQIVPSEGYHSDLSESELSFHEAEPTMVKQEKVFYNCGSTVEPEQKIFMDISTKMEYKEENEPSLLSWTRKHPEHWQSQEVLDWIYFVAEECFQDTDAPVRGENFNNVTGAQLCRMTLEDFMRCDGFYGKELYDKFRACLMQGRFIEPTTCEYTSDMTNSNIPDIFKMFQISENMEPISMDTRTDKMLDENLNLVTKIDDSDGVRKVNIGGMWIPFDDDPSSIPDALVQPGGAQDFDSFSDDDSDRFSDASNDALRYHGTVTSDFSAIIYARQRPHSSVSSDEGVFMDEPISPTETKPKKGRRVGQGSKGNHLWEFVRDLLKDPNFNPSLLRWEDKESGVFRFVQSEAVAKMWGRKKNNPGMTYEKLSRAMRFCRTAGYFAEVPKSGKFPKKLCFKFGHKAYGWKEV